MKSLPLTHISYLWRVSLSPSRSYWGVPPIRDDPLARNRRFYFFGDFSFLLVGMFHMAGYCGIGLRVCHIFLKFFVKIGKIGQKSYRLIKKLCFTRGMMVKIRGENCVSYKWVYPLVRNRRCQLTWPPKHVSYWWNPPVFLWQSVHCNKQIVQLISLF